MLPVSVAASEGKQFIVFDIWPVGRSHLDIHTASVLDACGHAFPFLTSCRPVWPNVEVLGAVNTFRTEFYTGTMGSLPMLGEGAGRSNNTCRGLEAAALGMLNVHVMEVTPACCLNGSGGVDAHGEQGREPREESQGIPIAMPDRFQHKFLLWCKHN